MSWVHDPLRRSLKRAAPGMMAGLLPPELVPFAALSPGQIAALVFVYGITATIRGALGFGAVAPVIVFSSMIIEPHHAVLLALATAVPAQFQIIPYGLRNGDWKVTRPLLVAGCIAIAAGVFVFKKLEPGWLTICLGFAMLVIALMDHFHLLERLAARVDLRRFFVALTLSTVSGLITGIAGGGGMYLYSVYLKLACPTPALMRGSSIMMGALLIFWRFAVTLAMGLISWRLIVESVLLLPVSLVGAWFGIRFFQRADAKRFYGAFQIVLMLGAVILLWKGFTRVA